jgi:hypothetical protein
MKYYPDGLGEKIQCKHCHQSGQMVSHGYIYKQHSYFEKELVGKRVFCSNRLRCFIKAHLRPIDAGLQPKNRRLPLLLSVLKPLFSLLPHFGLIDYLLQIQHLICKFPELGASRSLPICFDWHE